MTRIIRQLSVLLALLPGASAIAQGVDPANLLIRDVHIVSEEAEQPVLVNILIEDNKLSVVSQDDIVPEEGVSVVDGNKGFVLGALKIGQMPSLIILNLNPATNFDVLMDTEDFTVFALNQGRVVLNYLRPVDDAVMAREQATNRGWRGYTPPPLAVPMSYMNTRKWNRWDTRWVSGMLVAGVVLDRIRWGSQDSDSRSSHGNLGAYDGGEVRGFRVGAVGSINFQRPWVYTLFGATNAFDKGYEVEQQEDFTMFDYRLDIPLLKNTNVSIGNQKEPISMERLMPMTNIAAQERTAGADAMLPSRNFGLVVSGTMAERRVTWGGGVFNNWVNRPGGLGDNTTAGVGRVTWLPYMSADESNLLHIGVGLRYSDVKTGLRYASEPEYNKAPIFVDTGVIDADQSTQLSVETTWRRGPLWVGAEYLDSAVASPTLGDLDFSSHQLFATWSLTGEMRPYNRKSGLIGAPPISRTVEQGGWGAWEVAARYSSVDLTDGPVDGGDMDIWTIGLNWRLTPVFHVNASYKYITLDRFGAESNSDAVMARVLLLLE